MRDMSTIYLIRHGQASFGAEDYDCLSNLGIKQSRILGQSLSRLNHRFHAIYQGSLKRHIRTADEVLRCFSEAGHTLPEPIICDDFNEYDAIAVWQHHISVLTTQKPAITNDLKQIKTDYAAFQRIFEQVTESWISGKNDSDGCPRWTDFKARVIHGLHALIERHGSGKDIAVFTSGGTISVILQHALDLSNRKTIELSWQIMNASISRIRYGGNKITVSGFNDIGHLERSGNRELLTWR